MKTDSTVPQSVFKRKVLRGDLRYTGFPNLHNNMVSFKKIHSPD